MAQTEQQMAVQRIKDPAKRKAAYYKLQREHAEESGDQDTTDKIYAKLGKKSHNVDSSRGDKAILGVAPFLPEAAAGLGEAVTSGGLKALRSKAASLVPRLGKSGEAGEAESGSRALVPRRNTAPTEKHYQYLGKATPIKKALSSNKRALSGSKIPKVGSGTKSSGLSSGKVRQVSGYTQQANKSLSSSEHKDYQSELSKQEKRSKIPGGKKGAVKGSRKDRKFKV